MPNISISVKNLTKNYGDFQAVKGISFDVYEGDKIQQGKKAYALGFTLQDENKTLTDEEIEKVMLKLMSAFEGKMGAVIRK